MMRTPRRAVFGGVVQAAAAMCDGCSFACIHHRAQVHQYYTTLCQIVKLRCNRYTNATPCPALRSRRRRGRSLVLLQVSPQARSVKTGKTGNKPE